MQVKSIDRYVPFSKREFKLVERHANESSNSKIGRIETRNEIYNFYKFYVLVVCLSRD